MPLGGFNKPGGLEIGTHQLLVYSNNFNVLVGSINTVKKNKL
jgi:hypothetical protein